MEAQLHHRGRRRKSEWKESTQKKNDDDALWPGSHNYLLPTSTVRQLPNRVRIRSTVRKYLVNDGGSGARKCQAEAPGSTTAAGPLPIHRHSRYEPAAGCLIRNGRRCRIPGRLGWWPREASQSTSRIVVIDSNITITVTPSPPPSASASTPAATARTRGRARTRSRTRGRRARSGTSTRTRGGGRGRTSYGSVAPSRPGHWSTFARHPQSTHHVRPRPELSSHSPALPDFVKLVSSTLARALSPASHVSLLQPFQCQ